jgi:hypothetical protein
VRPLIGMGAEKLMPALIGRYEEVLAERKKQIFKKHYLPRHPLRRRGSGARQASLHRAALWRLSRGRLAALGHSVGRSG